ncbi:hypothetical protein HHI36_010181 [Cryptolaemus montrouzieri]|uniref:PiggyBac transposable element-derived protein 4 C-terminal zinc-ribbon domain-containing protein n=1 Tax=Cryptolaemus montrouzieri TaxID=559131 RepID=A0ABD2MIG0_9CUCU
MNDAKTFFMINGIPYLALRTDIRRGVEMILGSRNPQQEEDRIVLTKRSRCGLCSYKADRKTKMVCQSCERPMCDEHRAYMCNDCI